MVISFAVNDQITAWNATITTYTPPTPPTPPTTCNGMCWWGWLIIVWCILMVVIVVLIVCYVRNKKQTALNRNKTATEKSNLIDNKDDDEAQDLGASLN